MHILIIRPGAIGDTILTFPILQALRAQYPDPHITLVGNPIVLPLALSFGLVEEVSDYGLLQWSELFSTTGIHSPAIRNQLQRTDLAICWLRDPHGLVAQNLRQAGVKHIIIAPGRPPQDKPVHITEYLAQTVGASAEQPHSGNGEGSGRLSIPSRPAPIYRPPRFGGRDKSGPYDGRVAIHPGSGGAHKCWPAPSFAAVIERLWQRNYPVLLLAGPADHQCLKDIQNHIATPPKSNMLNLLLDAPLLEVAQHLQHCKCYLGNDSGITHLAAMLGIPTIALFGPTNPIIWQPKGPSVEVIYNPLLQQLPVEMVLEKLLRFL